MSRAKTLEAHPIVEPIPRFLSRGHRHLLDLMRQGEEGLPKNWFNNFPVYKKEARDLLWMDLAYWWQEGDGSLRLCARELSSSASPTPKLASAKAASRARGSKPSAPKSAAASTSHTT